jgi:8-oxo-dGTP pyrophosphatase MutT (NUDIX family)
MDVVEQVAVIPWQAVPALRVLLIRWIPDGPWGVPKGGIADQGNDHREAARRECLEEAGAIGQLGDFVGEFDYLRSGRKHHVRVLTMKVTELRERYRERGVRERAWFAVSEAAAVLEREPLRWLVSDLPRWTRT